MDTQNENSQNQYLSLPEKFIIPEYKFEPDGPNYANEVKGALSQVKNNFVQLSFFTDNLQENLYSSQKNERAKIEASKMIYQSSDFQVVPKEEREVREFIENANLCAKNPEILDFLIRVNYIYDSFPSLTPRLDDLLLYISMQNEYPLIKLALISQLFSVPSRKVEEKIYEFEMIDMTSPGEIVCCIFDEKKQEIIPLTINDQFFQVKEDSIYVRYYKHDYVFTPSTQTVSFCQTGHNKRVSTKKFSDFLIDSEEKVEEIGVFNDQLCFVQRVKSSSNLRVTLYKKGILVHDIIRKDYIIDLGEEVCEKCKMFQNNLLIFLTNGKKYLYNIAKHLLVKEPIVPQFFYEFSKNSIYDKINEVFILTNSDNDKLVYQIIKREKKKSNFIQILPPFYGVQTDELISRVCFELLNSSTEIISDLIDGKSSIKTNLVSYPILHIQYALDLAEIIQKNDCNHDSNLCEYCLIALSRFIIINIHQLSFNHQKLADFQLKRITRIFGSMKMSAPHFDTLFGLISIINYGIYTKSFISNVLYKFVPLLDDKKIMKTSSFILFIKPESVPSMNTKEKMSFLQNKINDFIDIYSELHLDEELIPFITIYLNTLEESLNSKSISNISISSYISALVSFLCIMDNKPNLSSVVLSLLIKNLEKLFTRISPAIEKVNKIFMNEESEQNHFSNTKSIYLKIQTEWLDGHSEFSNGISDDNYDPHGFYLFESRKNIPNEIFSVFNEISKDDLIIFLLPNAIVNCIRICYESIEITQDEKDNECYLSYEINHIPKNSKEALPLSSSSSSKQLPKRSSSAIVTSSADEKDFLSSLNEDSILIKRLRKEEKAIFLRNIPKEITDIELLIFKSLLFQSQLIKYAITVNETTQINQQVILAWKTAIKVRTSLRLAKQFEANKKVVHLDLKERYEDYIKSIKEKCDFLLNQSKINDKLSSNELIKKNYSFITSNLQLNQFFTLSELNAKREEIKKKSLAAIKKMLKLKIPKSFIRSFISCLAKNKVLNEVLTDDDDFYSYLISSDDPFIRLCTFDFIHSDEYFETAKQMKSNEEDPSILRFIDSIIKSNQPSDIAIDNLLEILGKSQYDLDNFNTINNTSNLMRNISEKYESFSELITKLNGFDDISLGVLVTINSIPSISENDLISLIPVLIKIQTQLPTDSNFKTNIILNLYVSCLNRIIKFDYNLFKSRILPNIDLSKYSKFIIENLIKDYNIPDILELYKEMKKKQLDSVEQNENPYFVQLKGNPSSINETFPNVIFSDISDYNFYVFSKPIIDKEAIKFHFKLPDDHETIERKSYVLIGTVDSDDKITGIISYLQCFDNRQYYSTYNDGPENLTDIILAKKENDVYAFFSYKESCNDYAQISVCENSKSDSPNIPFILIYGTNVTIKYEYCPNFKFDKDINMIPSDIEAVLDLEMTVIPSNIIGNKIHIDNIGDGIIISTNDKNDNAGIVIFDDNGKPLGFAEINISSTKFSVIKESHFLSLLRALSIADDFYDMKFISDYLIKSSNSLISESLLTYFVYSLDIKLLEDVLKDEKLLDRFDKKTFSLFIHENIDAIIEAFRNKPSIEISLIKKDLILDPISFIVKIYENLSSSSSSISIIKENVKYKKVQYKESDLDQVKKTFCSICNCGCLEHFSTCRNFVLLFNDILEFLFEYSEETIISNFHKLDQALVIHSLILKCCKPFGIPLLISVLYENYFPERKYEIPPNTKFVLNFKCKNITLKDTILEANHEYVFDYKAELEVIKPEIPDPLGIIKEFNKTEHIDTFIKIYNNRGEIIRFPIEDLKDNVVNSDILFLYLVLFEIFDQSTGIMNYHDSLFILKSMTDKLKYLNDELDYPFDDDVLFKFHRYKGNSKNELIFTQFYDKIHSDLAKLRNRAPFCVHFLGEGGIDQGGVRRECITLIYEELTNTSNGFFELQDNGYFIPNKNCSKEVLKVVGAFIGCCLISKNSRDFHLDPKIWAFFISPELSESGFEDEKFDESTIALKSGFNFIIPEDKISNFTAEDIHKLACGDSLTFEKFISCCSFYNNEIKKVFTEVVSKFSHNELTRLLQFITGSDTIPFVEFKIDIEFKDSRGIKDENKWPLPIAHTCFKSIEICNFENPNILADKLKLAMLTEFINDGRMDFEYLNFS